MAFSPVRSAKVVGQRPVGPPRRHIRPRRAFAPAVRRLALARVCALAALVAPAGAALACSCWYPTPEQLIRHVPTIFAGRVVEVRQLPESRPGLRSVVATIEVSERWKGEVPDRVEVDGSSHGASCGWSSYTVGERVAFFGGPAARAAGTAPACAP
jgi:hypothetical protein